MPLRIECTDVLDTAADALMLTVDGVKRGMEGNIARQFERRYPDDWQDMQREILYPVPLGRTVGFAWDGDCPWGVILIASTLNHIEVLTAQQKASVVRAACSEGLSIASRRGTRSVASAVMRGGWRLDMDEGFIAMGEAYFSAGHDVRQIEFQICLPDGVEVLRLSEIARNRKWI